MAYVAKPNAKKSVLAKSKGMKKCIGTSTAERFTGEPEGAQQGQADLLSRAKR